jgi:hypothetical protein
VGGGYAFCKWRKWFVSKALYALVTYKKEKYNKYIPRERASRRGGALFLLLFNHPLTGYLFKCGPGPAHLMPLGGISSCGRKLFPIHKQVLRCDETDPERKQ